ncbi:MAG: nuclear transport factor 2 family protein [candidate division WOR-3 bacterium]
MAKNCYWLLIFAGCAAVLEPADERAGPYFRGGVNVERFVEGFGQRRPSRLLGLFTSEPGIEIAGLGVVAQGRAEIGDFLAYGQVVKARLKLVELRMEADSVFCRLEEKNSWLELLGCSPLQYQAVFLLEEGKINRVRIRLEPASRAELIGKGLQFFNWLKHQEPQLLVQLMPDGRFRFNEENGKRFLELIRNWQGQN